MNLSIVFLANNDELDQVAETIKTLPFNAQIVIVSTSKVPDITTISAIASDVVTLHKPFVDDFSSIRNFADSKVSTDYVLHLDPDEHPTLDLWHEIDRIVSINADKSDFAYNIRRVEEFWGKVCRHGELTKLATHGITRLYQVGTGKWRGKVHEVFDSSRMPQLIQTGHIIHKSHESLAHFISKINFYSDLRASEISGKQADFITLLQLIIYPPLKFIYTFVIKSGYRDGAAGFAYSFMMSFHSFLVRAKLLTSTNVR